MKRERTPKRGEVCYVWIGSEHKGDTSKHRYWRGVIVDYHPRYTMKQSQGWVIAYDNGKSTGEKHRSNIVVKGDPRFAELESIRDQEDLVMQR